MNHEIADAIMATIVTAAVAAVLFHEMLKVIAA
jgi:hypothetical protein